MTIYRKIFGLIAVAGMLTVGPFSLRAQDSPAAQSPTQQTKQAAKNTGQDTKQAAKDTGSTVKGAAKTTGKAVKKERTRQLPKPKKAQIK